ncbi:MAG: nitroreductase family protein [Clostridia bacterium]|nr:nitroreductase family protein [Clostridia bacterium]
MNEVIRALAARKSVREFEERAVEAEKREAILVSACEAPTAGNQQLYTILDVTDGAKKARLAELCDHQPFIAKAPMVLIFLADVQKWYDAFLLAEAAPRRPGVGDLLLAVSDAIIAAQNAVVAAESLGLGSCYIGDVTEEYEEMRALLNLPEYVFPAAMLVIGYPTSSQLARKKPVRERMRHIVQENTYRCRDAEELSEMFLQNHPEKDWGEHLRAFCRRKYNSDFAREMTRSVKRCLSHFQANEDEK